MSDELRRRKLEAMRAQLGKSPTPPKPVQDEEKILTDETKEAVIAASKVTAEKAKEGFHFLKRQTEKVAEVAKERLTKKIVEPEPITPAVEEVQAPEIEEPATVIQVVEKILEVSPEPDPQAHIFEDLVAFVPQPEPEPQETPTEPAAEEAFELDTPEQASLPRVVEEPKKGKGKVVAAAGAGVLLVLAFGTWIFVKPESKTVPANVEVEALPSSPVVQEPTPVPTPAVPEPEPVKPVESEPEPIKEVIPDPVPEVKTEPVKAPVPAEKPKKAPVQKPTSEIKKEASWQEKANADLDNLLKD